eukprot:403374158
MMMLKKTLQNYLIFQNQMHYLAPGSTHSSCVRCFGVVTDMKRKLTGHFSPDHIDLIDQVGDESKINIIIVSDKFAGMLPLQRHRAINEVIKEEISKVHAVTIQAKTVKQYEQMIQESKNN